MGYSVGYLVYTVGTLLTAPAALNAGAAIAGAVFVAALAAVIVCLCRKSAQELKKEYTLKG